MKKNWTKLSGMDGAAEGCCGGPAPSGVDACCVADVDAKAAGLDGCGCGTSVAEKAKKNTSNCCDTEGTGDRFASPSVGVSDHVSPANLPPLLCC